MELGEPIWSLKKKENLRFENVQDIYMGFEKCKVNNCDIEIGFANHLILVVWSIS